MKSINSVLFLMMKSENTLKKTILDFIIYQPTAYSIDKVVEELKSESERWEESGKEYGGVSNDVCEWRLCDEEANVYDTSCRNPHILIEGSPRENNYKFCPYCGKKIKVVE